MKMEKEHLVDDVETGSSPNEFQAYSINAEQLNQMNGVRMRVRAGRKARSDGRGWRTCAESGRANAVFGRIANTMAC